MDWYVVREGETFGPFSFEVLVKGVREGEMRPDDFVWSNGMSDWAPARAIPGLWAPPQLPSQGVERAIGSSTAAHDARLVVPAPASSAWEPQEPPREPDRRRAQPTKIGLVRRHWRGDLALPASYWGIGVAVTLGLVVLGHLFGSVIGTLPFGPVGFGVALGAFLIFVCVCTVWQFVGIWRSAGSHMQSTGRRLWGSLARVAVVLGALRAVYDFNTVIGPMLAESGRIATRTENIAPHQLRLLRDGTEVELAGAMPLGTADALRRLLDAAPGVQVVHLNSVGGRVSEGYEIYQLVRDRKLITYTATNCMSACTIAFLGGVQRLLSTRASLGFHSISFAGIDQRLIPEINAELRQTLLSHGAPAWFVEKALTTNADSMWYPTKGELTAAKIVTGVVDPDQFGFSGIRNWRDQESLERGLLEIPLYALVRDNDPEMFKRVAGKFAEGVKLGRSVIEITRDVQSILQQQIIPKYLLAAPDGVLLRYWRTQLAEMEHLRRTDPAHCIAYLFPQFRGKNFKLNDFIPEKLLQEDIVLLTELVREAIKNPVASKAIDFEEEVARVFERISVKFPRAQELLSEPLKYTNEPDALCSAFLAFYFDVMSLPTERSAAVMRAVLDPGR